MNTRELVRIPDWVHVTDAVVAPNQEYWYLKKLEYQDDTLSGGLHHIFVQEPHDITINARVTTGSESFTVLLEKPANEPAGNFPMYGGITYACEMEGLPSDRVDGMHMPSKHHVNYILTYEKRRKGTQPMGDSTLGTSGGIPPVTTPSTLPHLLVTRGDAAQLLTFNKDAALQKVIFRDGFVPNSPEFTVAYDGRGYLAQRAEHLDTGEVRIYYCPAGQFDNVSFVRK